MIKQFKLWQWKRRLKQHQGFSKETNEFIQRIVTHINKYEFVESDIKEQMLFIEQAYASITALEMICEMNKMFNLFFDTVNTNSKDI